MAKNTCTIVYTLIKWASSWRYDTFLFWISNNDGFPHAVDPSKSQFGPLHEGEVRGRTLSQDELFTVSIIFNDKSWSEVLKADINGPEGICRWDISASTLAWES